MLGQQARAAVGFVWPPLLPGPDTGSCSSAATGAAAPPATVLPWHAGTLEAKGRLKSGVSVPIHQYLEITLCELRPGHLHLVQLPRAGPLGRWLPPRRQNHPALKMMTAVCISIMLMVVSLTAAPQAVQEDETIKLKLGGSCV